MTPALLDTNVLIHAVAINSPLHRIAATVLERALKVRGLYCIAPQNLTEFCAVLTRGRGVTQAVPPAEVVRCAARLYRSRCLAKIYPKRATIMRAVQAGTRLGVTGAAWYDLFLAATMRDNGVRVVITEDAGDFGRIPFVTVRKLNQLKV